MGERRGALKRGSGRRGRPGSPASRIRIRKAKGHKVGVATGYKAPRKRRRKGLGTPKG